MNKVRTIKAILLGACLLGMLLLFGVKSFTGAYAAAQKKKQDSQGASSPPTTQKNNTEDFVGTETCQACHETQFNTFSRTTHAKLEHDASWKGKVVGCESCHGAGKAHVETMAEVVANGTDPKLILDKKIVYLAALPSKQVSETCLQCHAGREEHNNYRRGEHWRNDVGCTDCHFAHAPDPAPLRSLSHTLISDNTRRQPDSSTLRMLKSSEPQLCMKCHTEQKAQFSMPFRHKVLEGLIKCSDCHNAHGGFELKQTRLANFSASDASCAKCHNDKAGPFNYEHGPVSVEGCSSCHTPHGANNPKLLKRNNVFQLCIECHTNTHAIANSDEEGGAPNTPSFHNLTQARYQNCTTCHVMIHGSNSHPFFFR